MLCILCENRVCVFTVLLCIFVLKISIISPFDAKKSFSITISLENQKLTKINWNRNTPKPIDFQPFQSISVENFTNRNIQFRLAIPIKTDRNQTKHTPSLCLLVCLKTNQALISILGLFNIQAKPKGKKKCSRRSSWTIELNKKQT